MLSLDTFFTRLMHHVPGCPEPTARQALLDAATDFCDRTRAIRVTTEPMPVQPGVAEYELDLPSGVEPAQIVRAWMGTRPLALPPEAHRWFAAADAAAATTGAPVALLPGEAPAVRLFPTPTDSLEKLTVRLATRPTSTATQVMDALFTHWRDAIVAGAVVRLASIPGKTFSSADQAGFAASVYQAGLSRARMEAQRDLTGEALHAQPLPFA